MNQSILDTLRDCYKEQVDQARHHENQRERITAIIVAVTTAFVSVISHSDFDIYTLPLSILLVLIGVFGYSFSRKHYERNRLHTTISRHYLKAIDDRLLTPDSEVPVDYMASIHSAGREDHKKNYVIRSTKEATATGWRLHTYWNSVHVVIFILGIILTGTIWALWACKT